MRAADGLAITYTSRDKLYHHDSRQNSSFLLSRTHSIGGSTLYLRAVAQQQDSK